MIALLIIMTLLVIGGIFCIEYVMKEENRRMQAMIDRFDVLSAPRERS